MLQGRRHDPQGKGILRKKCNIVNLDRIRASSAKTFNGKTCHNRSKTSHNRNKLKRNKRDSNKNTQEILAEPTYKEFNCAHSVWIETSTVYVPLVDCVAARPA